MASQRKKVGGTQLLLVDTTRTAVMSIDEDRDQRRITTSFDRGRPVSAFTSSTSQVILANLGADQQQRRSLQHASEIAEAELGTNWPHSRIACASSW